MKKFLALVCTLCLLLTAVSRTTLPTLTLPLLVLLFGIPAGCILGTLKVLADRIREIRKGEEDAYRNY